MNFISEDFHLHYLASYKLYIKSGFESDHLLVISKEGDVLVFLQYDNMNPCAEAKRILALPFTQVFVNIPQQNLIWVPNDVYADSDKELYTSYFIYEDVDKILVKRIEALGAIALYQFDSLVLNRWHKLYPEATIIPSFELLIDHCEKNKINNSEAALAIHVYDNQADLLLLLNGEFKLFNTYEINSVDDLSYYVLSMMKNFSLTKKFDQILIAGVSSNSEYFNRLGLYSNQVELLSPVANLNFENEALKKVLLHSNLLLDRSLCV